MVLTNIFFLTPRFLWWKSRDAATVASWLRRAILNQPRTPEVGSLADQTWKVMPITPQDLHHAHVKRYRQAHFYSQTQRNDINIDSIFISQQIIRPLKKRRQRRATTFRTRTHSRAAMIRRERDPNLATPALHDRDHHPDLAAKRQSPRSLHELQCSKSLSSQRSLDSCIHQQDFLKKVLDLPHTHRHQAFVRGAKN